MQIYQPFHFDSRHWLLALLIALSAHTILFLSYKSTTDNNVEKISQKSIVIQLKKITRPPKVTQPPIIKPKVEPLPEAMPIPKLKPKPKVIQKPKLKAKPEPVPLEIPEQVIEEQVKPIQKNTSNRVSKNEAVPDSNVESVDITLKQKYESRLLAWLEKHKRYPMLARRRGQQGTIVLEFTISANGKLVTHKIAQASEHTVLNGAVEKMIKRASPMPPVPQDLRRNQTEFTYTVPINFALQK